MSKIVLLEDDEVILSVLTRLLTQHGYEVLPFRCCRDFSGAETAGDLYLLDISLPDGSGLDLCRRIRAASGAPILMLTAAFDEETLVQALQLGADDYIAKPFRTRELLARIRAHLRRGSCRALPDRSPGLVLDQEAEAILWQGENLHFTRLEYCLVKYMMTHSGQRIPREQLLNLICANRGELVEDNTLTVHLSRIRKKLKQAGCEIGFETCWGGGYRWNDEKHG